MEFARSYVELVESIGARLALPPVRRLYLPPECRPDDKHAEFGVLELADGSAGLVYLLLDDLWRRARDELDPAALAGAGVLALASGYVDPDPLRRALAMGAINAVSQHLFSAAGFEPPESVDVLELLRPPPGGRMGMVGYFPPLVAQLRERQVPLTVIELDPARVERDGEFEVTLDASRLADCDAVLCTATTLLNDSLAGVLAKARGARRFALVGPTAGAVPDPLFAAGVDYVAGSRVVDAGRLVERCERQLRWGDSVRKYCLGADAYPGLERLLERALRRV